MVLSFGALKNASDSYIDSIGLIWEYMENAGPRSINNCPQFSSCRFMHREDWKIAKKAIIELDSREKADVESVLNDSVPEPNLND